MATSRKIIEKKYNNRRKLLRRRIRGQIAVFPSAPVLVESRDLEYPFRQNSDFSYLTGFDEPESVLVLVGSSKGPRSVLFLRDRSEQEERWTGERLGLRRAKRRFDVDEVFPIEAFQEKLSELVQGVPVLHYAPGINPRIDDQIWSIFKRTKEPDGAGPHTLKDSRLLTGPMRVVKDKDEVSKIRRAAQISCRALLEFIPEIRTVKSERHAAKSLENHFARLGAEGPAFPTIVASGKHSTVLHHSPTFAPLWKREPVLIDSGALFQGYAADITRSIPVSGRFTEPQARIYDLVHKALQAGIDKAVPGNSLNVIHSTVVRTITAGLVELGLLQGKVSDLIAEKAYTRYYMHRSGHWLGLDVHDISPIYCDEYLVPPYDRPLEAGNVLTIEPGLYFDPSNRGTPEEYRGIGIRLEEDILITNRGSENLTADMPILREDIEALIKA